MGDLIDNTIKAEWTNADALDLQPTYNQLATDCTECEDYDTERHSCPRYCETIRKTVEEVQPERKTGKWIEYDNSHCECPFCHVEWSYFDNEVECFNYCPSCGTRLEGEG